jgi:hypothetical protein
MPCCMNIKVLFDCHGCYNNIHIQELLFSNLKNSFRKLLLKILSAELRVDTISLRRFAVLPKIVQSRLSTAKSRDKTTF